MEDLPVLVRKASSVHHEQFGKEAWFGKCIFLSWYCAHGDCTFCYRSTMPNNIAPEKARRSLPSILVEALLCKHLNWELEFLTGGYGIFPFDELVEICRLVAQVMGQKIWLNMGLLTDDQLAVLKPYVAGIVASIETVNPSIHKQVCPSKPFQPYSDMLKKLKGFKKSITIIIGLGETLDDFPLLEQCIKEHHLDKITFYALKPVKGTAFENNPGPSSAYYAAWIAKTRIAFPRLEIMAGITPKRAEDVKILLEAGANAITKFSATKLFNSDKARLFEQQAAAAGRAFQSRLTQLPEVDWEAAVDQLDTDEPTKKATKALLNHYIHKMAKKE